MSRKWAALENGNTLVNHNQSRTNRTYAIQLWGGPYASSLNGTPIRYGLIGWHVLVSQRCPLSRHGPDPLPLEI